MSIYEMLLLFLDSVTKANPTARKNTPNAINRYTIIVSIKFNSNIRQKSLKYNSCIEYLSNVKKRLPRGVIIMIRKWW
jgi:hypothetical protein